MLIRTENHSLAILLILLLVLQGCSVGMAASGYDDPDLTVLKEGSSRDDIEKSLGKPKEEKIENETHICIYEFKIGDQRSAGRAVGNAVLDIVTIGLWELAATPIEASKGDKIKATIVYGNDNTAKSIKFDKK